MPKLEDKNKDKQNIVEQSINANISRLGPTLNIKGELSCNEDLIIEGQFQGKLDLKNHNLSVEQAGKVDADIHASNITIKGKVKGNIFASGKVYIQKEGQMIGDVSASRISILDGAQFKGSVKMVSAIQ